jgi:hypothetical protein
MIYHAMMELLSLKPIKMTEQTKKTRRGVALYDTNPFVGVAVSNTRQGVKRISNKDGDRMMIVSEGTGEVVAPAGFWQAQEVDKTQFVKLYVNGVKAFKDLTGAGTKVFELLYLEVQKQIGKDKVYLSFNAIEQLVTPMSSSTYDRGMRELIEKKFIASSMLQGWFFINPDYMWNGDRLAFVKEYRKAPSKPKPAQVDTKTLDMFDHKDANEAQENSISQWHPTDEEREQLKTRGY